MITILNDLGMGLHQHVYECGQMGGMYSKKSESDIDYNQNRYKKRFGEIDGLGNIEYILRSDDSRKIKVPLKYAIKSSKLVNYALESKGVSEFNAKLYRNEEVENVYIPDKINEIIGEDKRIGSDKSRKLIDKIYFETCLHQGYDELISSRGNEKLETMQHIEFFKGILNSL